MAFEGKTPKINHQFLDMELEGITSHFDNLSLNPLHRYLFLLGMVFRTSQERLIAYQHCIDSHMTCEQEKQKSDIWQKLFEHALLKIASLPPVYNEIVRRVDEERCKTRQISTSTSTSTSDKNRDTDQNR